MQVRRFGSGRDRREYFGETTVDSTTVTWRHGGIRRRLPGSLNARLRRFADNLARIISKSMIDRDSAA
jgi:hypothetical protein